MITLIVLGGGTALTLGVGWIYNKWWKKRK